MSTTDRTPIATAASLFTESYVKAMQLSDVNAPTAKDIPTIAQALGSHYSDKTTSYTCGHNHVFESTSAAIESVATHLGKFERSGLGYDIYMEKHRIEVLSEWNAMCWITWKIRPGKGAKVEGWSWENIYAYRRAVAPGAAEEAIKIGAKDASWEKPEGVWEAIFSDNEIMGLVQRVPNFMEL